MKLHILYNRYKGAALAVLLALPVSGVMAQTKLGLDECLEAALRQSRILESGRLSVAETEAGQGAAWTMDKMEITLSQDPTSGGSPDNAVSVEQRFEFPTVYAARHRQAKAETELENRRYAALEQSFRARVSSLYCALSMMRQSLQVYSHQDSVYSLFETLAEARYGQGETSRLEVYNARQARQRNRMAMAEVDQQYCGLQAELRDAMGVDYLVEPEVLSFEYFQTDSVAYDFAASPFGQVLQQQVDVSRHQLKSARNEFAPDITLAARTQAVVKGFNPYDEDRAEYADGNFMGFEVGVAVPVFFGGQRSKAKAARLAFERSELDLEQSRVEAESAYRKALAECTRTRQVVEYYEATGHAEQEEMARLAQVSYENGEIGYIEYIQNQEAALGLHLNHLKAINDWQQAVITLNSLR